MNPSSSGESGLTLRERLKLATRDAILDAAAAAFADGAANVRMEDVAGRAGIAVGTVYNYFTDRTALIAALLENRKHALIAALDRTADDDGAATPDGFRDELERFVGALVGYMDTNRALLHELLEEEAQRGIDSQSARRRKATHGQILERAQRLMARGVKVKALQKGDPLVYSSLLLGMVRGVGMTALAQREAQVADSTGHIVRVFLHGAAR